MQHMTEEKRINYDFKPTMEDIRFQKEIGRKYVSFNYWVEEDKQTSTVELVDYINFMKMNILPSFIFEVGFS